MCVYMLQNVHDYRTPLLPGPVAVSIPVTLKFTITLNDVGCMLLKRMSLNMTPRENTRPSGVGVARTSLFIKITPIKRVAINNLIS